MAPRKIDLYAKHKTEYVTPKTPAFVRIAAARYLSIDGQGAPGGDRFSAAIGALYGAAFTIKMTRKFAGKQDYAIAKLEAQWFFDGDPATTPREEWRWKLMIRTPMFVTGADLRKAVRAQLDKGKPAEVTEVALETIREGQCVQMLHVGPYEREAETLTVMQAFAESRGLAFTGPHHEIYLSDPRRVPPARLRTILREPVRSRKRRI